MLGSTAPVERGCICSLQARSFSFQGWGLIDLPPRALSQSAHFIFKGSLVDLRLPAFREQEDDRLPFSSF